MFNIIRNESVDGALLEDLIADICREKSLISRLKPNHRLRIRHSAIRVLQSDRNLICDLILTKPRLKLIIKFATPINKFEGITYYETQQWKFLVSVITRFECGILPDVIAFDDDSSILILGKIEGPTMHQVMKYSPFYQIFFKRKGSVLIGCYNLGIMLATLHSQKPCCSHSPMKYSTFAKLDSIADQASADKLFERGISNFNAFHKLKVKTSWTHGNLRCDNIIFASDDAALIDLENAGAGDAMEDLGRLFAFILMFRRLSLFPRHFWQAIIESILNGYCSIATVPCQQLLTSILGEVLFVYGRDYVVNPPTLFHRQFEASFRSIVLHLLRLLQEGPEMVQGNPRILVK